MTNHYQRGSDTFAFCLGVIVVIALIALSAGPVAAQSGRRAPRSPPPAPKAQPTPEEKKPEAEPQDANTLIVGMDRSGTFSIIPMYLYDSVLRSCADRLDDSPSVKVDLTSRDMHRGDAIKRAKAETDSHVVLMQLKTDGSMGREEDLREVYVEYWVFAPTTAKMVTNGRSYQQIARAGGVIMMPRPGGRASLPYTEQLLKQAGRDAAERILSALNLPGRKVPG